MQLIGVVNVRKNLVSTVRCIRIDHVERGSPLSYFGNFASRTPAKTETNASLPEIKPEKTDFRVEDGNELIGRMFYRSNSGVFTCTRYGTDLGKYDSDGV